MIEEFLKHLEPLTDFDRNCKILVAVSGGADSIVLSHLLHSAGYTLVIAHCNFGLRGIESDEDESFVRRFSVDLKIPVFVKHFDTANYAEKNKISIQMAARDLRYNWFQELVAELDCKFIAVAHHQDDQIETFFINLFRGSGIKGLSVMLPKNGNIIRPLLFMQRAEIEQYANVHKLTFRTDSSNAKNAYLRNNIRNNLLPQLYQMIDGSKNGILKSLQFLSANEELYNELVADVTKDFIQIDNGIVRIEKAKLLKFKALEGILFETISPYGFKGFVLESIVKALKSEPGTIFISGTHRLTINRDVIEIEPIGCADVELYYINQGDTEIRFPVSLQFTIENRTIDFNINKTSAVASIDFDKLKFPLIIRKWKKGDRFVPFGMQGSKLLSDFFIDQHFTRHQKENCWLLCNNDDLVIWVIGYRISDVYKITDKTRLALIIRFNN